MLFFGVFYFYIACYLVCLKFLCVDYGYNLNYLVNVTDSDTLSFDVRTRSLARRRATTVIKQEEEEVDCNTRIVQEGEYKLHHVVYQLEVVCLQTGEMY